MKTFKFKAIARHRLLIWTILILGLIASLCVYGKVRYINQYDRAAQQASLAQIRRLIVQAVSALKVDAPVDAKTGAAFFPEARLYVPGSMPSDHLIYVYDPTIAKPGLSVGSQKLLNRDVNKMYAARDVDGTFAAVPHLQTCERGVRLSYTKAGSFDGAQFRQAVKLSNGQQLYMYYESGCPQLSEVLSTLKSIDSY